MKTALLELKKAIIERLNTDISSTAKVYDNVPEGAAMPYIVVGETTVIDWGTKTFNGEEITTTIHVWSNKKPKTETMKIMGLVVQSLSTPLVLGDNLSIEIAIRDFMQAFDDPNGVNHGVVRYRFKISQ